MSGFSRVVVAALLSLGSIVVASQHAGAEAPPGVMVDVAPSDSPSHKGVFAPTTQSSTVASTSTYLGLSLVGLTLAGILRSRMRLLRSAGEVQPAKASNAMETVVAIAPYPVIGLDGGGPRALPS